MLIILYFTTNKNTKKSNQQVAKQGDRW